MTYAAEKIITRLPEYPAGVPLKVIPCSADLELFNAENIDEAQKLALRKNLGLKQGDFVLSYLGSIGGWYLTAEMMMFCKRLLSKIPAAKFLFISPNLHEYIADTAAKYGVPREKIISVKAVRSEVPALLSLSSYSLFFIKPCFSKLSSSPTKHGELMAMGVPVVANGGVGDVKEIIEKYHGGFVVDDFSDASFDKVIAQLETTVFDKGGIRDGAAEFYALEKAVASYTALYNEIFKNR